MNKTISINKKDLFAFIGGLYIFMIPAKPILPISIFYGLGFFCFLLLLISDKKLKIKLLLFEKTYLIFFLVCCIGLLYTESEYAVSLCFRILFYIIGVFSSLRLLNYNNEKMESFYKASNFFIYGTIFISVYCLIIEGINKMRLGEIVFQGVYGTYIELSICLLISTILVTIQLFYNKKKILKNIILFSILIIFCILSQTRKVFVGVLFIIIFTAFWKSNRNIKLKIKYIIFGIIGLCIVYYAINNVELLQNIKTRFEGFLLYLQGKETYDNSSIIRAKMRETALNAFYNSPTIGNGTDSARIFINSEFGLDLYSHCNFTEILCNNGIIGFCIYYFYHIFSIIKSFINRKRNIILSGIIVCSLIVLIIMDYGQVSYYNVEFIYIYLLLSYLFEDFTNKNTKKNNLTNSIT